MVANAVFTGRPIGTTRPRALTLRMAATDLLMLVPSRDTVPPDHPRRGPVGRDGFHQITSGMFSEEGDALSLAELYRERIQPERFPAVVEAVQQPEVMAAKVKDGRGRANRVRQR